MSVVVPVFDPGPYIERAIASILGQTLPAGQVEAIFVDDGSTDGTSARLDRVAAEHPLTVSVIHIPASGAPGRPRNVGIEAARGDYIQFLDADDELAPDALERLVAVADRNGSDIVVGKFASATSVRSQRLFERTVERTTLAASPHLADSSLGPTKLFRRAFVREHGIAFPEGWRAMEDQHFVLQAYLGAHVVSILADHPCYFFHQREDDGHLTAEPVDPERHAANVRAILDMVDAKTRPGSLRRRIYRRLLVVEVLRRVSEPAYLGLDAAARARLFTAARDLVRERFDLDMVEALPALGRVRCELLRDDRPDELLELARRLADLDGSARLESIRWRTGNLEIDLVERLDFGAGVAARSPVLVRADRRTTFDLAGGDGSTERPIDVTGALLDLRTDVVVRQRPTALEWHVKAHTSLQAPSLRSSPAAASTVSQRMLPIRVQAHADLDLVHIGAGVSPIGSGTWDVLTQLSYLGIRRLTPLSVPDPAAIAATCRPALLGDPARVIVPLYDTTGLRLEVDPPPDVLAAALTGRPVRVVRDGERLTLELPMASGPTTATLPVGLAVGAPGRERVVEARLRAWQGAVVIDARVRGLSALARGEHPIALRLGGPHEYADVPLGTARVEGRSRLRIDGLPRLSVGARLAGAAMWPLIRLGGTARSWRTRATHLARHTGRALIHQLPDRPQRSAMAVVRRFR